MQSQTKLGNARMKLPLTSVPSTIVSFCPYDVAWLERWKIQSKTFAVLTKSSGSWYPFLYVSIMDFASIHSRLRNPVLHLKLYRHGFFGPLQSCNIPNSAFRRNHGLLPFLSYLTMAWDLLPFLSYPSPHPELIKVILRVPNSNAKIFHTVLHLFSSTYQLFLLLCISLGIQRCQARSWPVFSRPLSTPHSSLRQPVFPIFPIPCKVSLTPPRMSCAISISKSQHSPILFPLSP